MFVNASICGKRLMCKQLTVLCKTLLLYKGPISMQIPDAKAIEAIRIIPERLAYQDSKRKAGFK